MEYQAESLDEAISKCLAEGNDPFNPQIISTEVIKPKKAIVEE